MNSKEYEYFNSKLAALIDSIKDLRKEIDEMGGFLDPVLEEEFLENIECSYIALSDSLENLQQDKKYMEMDEEKNSNEEED